MNSSNIKGEEMSEKNENEIPQVGEVDPSKKTSPIVDEDTPNESEIEVKDTICWFNDARYGRGARICSLGSMLVCQVNGWFRIGRC